MRAAALPMVLILLLAGCASAPRADAPGGEVPPAAPPRAAVGTAAGAVANLAAASGTLVSGRIALRPEAGGVRLAGTIGGLNRNGAHALQVHARGDCSAVDARSAGPYFDAAGTGDVAGSRERIVADATGVATVDLLLPGAVLGGGAGNDIAGRALVVMGATRGASGARVACGVIRAGG